MKRILMTNWAKLGTVTLLTLFGSMVQAQDAGARIAFVNAEKIFVESNMAKAAQSRLQNEFAKRQNEIRDGAQKIKATAEKLDRDAAVMPEAERIRKQRELADFDRDLQRKNRELNDDAAQRNAEERAKIAERASVALRQIAEQRKIDIIFQEPSPDGSVVILGSQRPGCIAPHRTNAANEIVLGNRKGLATISLAITKLAIEGQNITFGERVVLLILCIQLIEH
ncbi:MAG: OmpH family outer membrane protein [Burkholderiaceae bacterium]|nr:OmpH family outer membrane protein [Burkholderiaceae bacterium]